MKEPAYFEMHEPYYALIKARGFDEAFDIYEKEVCQIDTSDFFSVVDQNNDFNNYRLRMYKEKATECQYLSYARALATFYKALDVREVQVAEKMLNGSEGLLLLDVDLI